MELIWVNTNWQQAYEGRTVSWGETMLGYDPQEGSIFTAYFARTSGGSMIIVSNIAFGTSTTSLYVDDSNYSQHREFGINHNGIIFANGYGFVNPTGMIKHNEYLVPYAVFRNK